MKRKRGRLKEKVTKNWVTVGQANALRSSNPGLYVDVGDDRIAETINAVSTNPIHPSNVTLLVTPISSTQR